MLGAVGTLAINPHLYAKLPYDPQRDFRPVSLLAATPYVLLLSPNVPARSVKELIEYARARPGQLNFGSGGVGTGNHLSAELFELAAGLDLAHVPYKGANLVVPDMLAGQVHMVFLNVLAALPHMKSGRLRALAVTTSRRSPSVPDIPTVAEAGIPGYDTSSWHGVVVPARTPDAIVQRLHAELAGIARHRDVRERLEALGAEVIGSTPEAFAAWIRSENAKWAKVIKAAGIRAE
jgi:tripartite-type tricarboxylate transporter receptor subunit TctC